MNQCRHENSLLFNIDVFPVITQMINVGSHLWQSDRYIQLSSVPRTPSLAMLPCPLSGCRHLQGNLMIIEEDSGAKEPLYVLLTLFKRRMFLAPARQHRNIYNVTTMTARYCSPYFIPLLLSCKTAGELFSKTEVLNAVRKEWPSRLVTINCLLSPVGNWGSCPIGRNILRNKWGIGTGRSYEEHHPPPCSPLVRGFLGQCPHGELDKQKLFDMYCLLLPPGIAKIFVDQLFTLFDGDKSGSIDFKVRLQ